MEIIGNILIETIEFKWYKLEFIFDKDWNFFWLLVNGKNRADVVKEILNRLCPDEVEVYIWGFDEDANQELNLKLLDLVFNKI